MRRDRLYVRKPKQTVRELQQSLNRKLWAADHNMPASKIQVFGGPEKYKKFLKEVYANRMAEAGMRGEW